MKGSLKEKLVNLKWPVFGIFGKLLIDLVFSTVRIDHLDYEKAREEIESGEYLIALWHSRILMVSYVYREIGAAVLVSRSNDGEMMAQVLERQGHRAIRGSSSRSGAPALSQLIKAVKEKHCAGVIVPDGPRGPGFKVQPGIIALAQKTGYPIVPISCSAKRLKVFSSWDRFILPYPFNEGCLIYGDPTSVPDDLDPDTRELYRVKLENEMNRITRQVDGHYGHSII